MEQQDSFSSENTGFLPPSPKAGARLPISVLWPKGVSGNPGGVPKGTRISTWMGRFGEKPFEDWPKIGSEEFRKLPGNAQIALRRLYRANKDDLLALKNSEYVEPRSRQFDDGGAEQAIGIGQGIIAALIAAERAGLIQLPPPPIDGEKCE